MLLSNNNRQDLKLVAVWGWVFAVFVASQSCSDGGSSAPPPAPSPVASNANGTVGQSGGNANGASTGTAGNGQISAVKPIEISTVAPGAGGQTITGIGGTNSAAMTPAVTGSTDNSWAQVCVFVRDICNTIQSITNNKSTLNATTSTVGH